MSISRRQFLHQFSLGGAGAAAGLAASLSVVHASSGPIAEVTEQLSIPDDWWVGGYKACYHGRGKDPKHFVDLVTIVGRTGGCSAGFIRRWIISIAESTDEANAGIAYLNRGIRHGWLIHGRPRSSGMPLCNLRHYYDDVPAYVGTSKA